MKNILSRISLVAILSISLLGSLVPLDIFVNYSPSTGGLPKVSIETKQAHAAVKTFYFHQDAAPLAGSWIIQDGTIPDAASNITTVSQSPSAVNHTVLRPGVTSTTTGTPGTTPIGYGWFSNAQLSGTFASGAWTFNVRRSDDRASVVGHPVFQVFRVPQNTSLTGATLLFSYDGNVGCNFAPPADCDWWNNNAATGITHTWTSASVGPFTLANEYLFIEAWDHETTISAGKLLKFIVEGSELADADRTKVTTPDFAAAPAITTVDLTAAGIISTCPTGSSVSGWTQLTADGAVGSPSQREFPSSSWDSLNNRLLVFGGYPGFNDLWQYTSAGGWTQLTADGAVGSPARRFGHSSVWDSLNNRLLVFGGSSGAAYFNDLWQYTSAGGWTQLTADGAVGSPARRSYHSAVWDSQNNRLLVFGGLNVVNFNDLWSYTSAGGWTQLTADGAVGSPAQRKSHSSVWDSQNNRLLVFGGVGAAYFNDLWSYTSAGGWTQLTADGAVGSPAKRTEHSAVWDLQNNRLLVFGGEFNAVYLNDLWQYTSAGGWTQLTADGAAGSPARRYRHSSSWDSQNNRLLVFGGYLSTTGWRSNDLWQWILPATSARESDTIRINGSGFGATQGVSTVSVNGASVTPGTWSDTVLSGIVIPSASTVSGNITVTVSGQSGNFAFTILPRLCSITDSSGTVEGPGQIDTTLDDQIGKIIQLTGDHFGTAGTVTINTITAVQVVGSCGASAYNNTCINVRVPGQETSANITGTIYATRSAPTAGTSNTRSFTIFAPSVTDTVPTNATNDQSAQSIQINGAGFDTENMVSNKPTVELRKSTVWNQLTADGAVGSPARRYGHSAVWDSQNSRLLVFGGTIGGAVVNDLWSYTSAGGWVQLTADGAVGSPAQRWGHSSTWDSQNNRLLVFGGSTGVPSLNDLWSYTSAGGWTQLTANGAADSPAQRYSHSGTWDSQNNRLLVFGGRTVTALNDLWSYTSAGGWTQLTADGAVGSPARRYNHSSAWDSLNNRLLVFGGDIGGAYLNDLWSYTSAGGWVQLTADGAVGSPARRFGSSAAWDSQNNRLLVFGGNASGVLFNDLWSYTSTGGWTQLTADGAAGSPVRRYNHSSAWDSLNNRLLVFGGYNNTVYFNDLWEKTINIIGTGVTADTVNFPYVRLTGTFNLNGVQIGFYIVRVTNPDGQLGDWGNGTTTGFEVRATVPVITPPAVPNQGYDNGTVTGVALTGNNFTADTLVKLATTGQTDILSSPACTYSSGTSMTGCSFNLTDRLLGPWDIVASNSTGPGTCGGCFTILDAKPLDPSNLNQYIYPNGSTAIPVGGGTNQTSVILKMTMQGGKTGATYYPEVEVRPLLTSFTNTVTASGSGVVWSGGAGVTGSVTVDGLTSGQAYHWQGRVRSDVTGGTNNSLSNWVLFGANPEADVDFKVDTTPPTVNLDGGSCSTAIPFGSISASGAQVKFNTSDPTGSSYPISTQVEYDTDSALSAPNSFSPILSVPLSQAGLLQTISLLNLTASTTYYLKINATDGAGNGGVSNPASAPFCSFSTTSINPSKTVEYFIFQENNPVNVGVAKTRKFRVRIPENSINIKSAFIEISGSTTGAATQTMDVELRRGPNAPYVSPGKTYTFPSQGTGIPFTFLYNSNDSALCANCQDMTDLNGGSNQTKEYTIHVTPTVGTNVNILNARLTLTYSYTP